MLKVAQIEKALENAFGEIKKSKLGMFELTSYQIERIKEDFESNGYADIDLEFGNEYEGTIEVEVNCELSTFNSNEPKINIEDMTIAQYNEDSENYDIMLTYEEFINN